MWSKLLVAIVAVCLVYGVTTPRKLFKVKKNEEISVSVPVSPLKDPPDKLFYRLPNNTRPIHYDVWLKTDIDQGKFEFTGRVTILIEAIENTKEVTLHYRQLTIEKVTLERSTGSTIQSSVDFTSVEYVEFLKITTKSVLIKNTQYRLIIDYHGVLRDDNAGFHRSSYLNSTGHRKWLAATQFGSTDARHAFPCYDEPAIRTSWTIEIQHDASYLAISNMPEESSTSVPGTSYDTTKFEKLESAPSYQIAFIVSDFLTAEDWGARVAHRVFAREDLIDAGQGNLAIDVSRKILDGFERHFETKFSLPKIDQGLVTNREQYVLFDETTGTSRDRENVITTIAHQFAHQWFGNLVSPAWWSYLWLNEGFATLYENHILELVYPGERWDDSFLVETVQPVMETDADVNIRPMSFYVESPQKIDSLFDSIAYSKSGSVLKMLQHAFGDSTWQKGVKNYLANRAYNFGTPEDFHKALAIDRPEVSLIMDSWTSQSGFPVIKVSRVGNSLKFEQNRFLYTDRDLSTTLWWVPINYVVGSNPDFESTKPDLWMRGVESVILPPSELPKEFTADDWIIVNSQQSGYYRVNYEFDLWTAIIALLKRYGGGFSKIHPSNRAQLIDDSFHLARAALVPFQTVFGILDYLEKEVDYLPWYAANRATTLLNRWISGSASYESFQEFMRKNSQTAYLHYGLEVVPNEPRVDRYARNIAIHIACQAQNPVCLEQTNKRLRSFVFEGGNELSPDVASTIYCNGLRTADRALFEAMKSKMILSENAAEKNTLLSAMSCVQDQVILADYFDYAINNSNLTVAQRSRILLSAVNIGRDSLGTLIEFVRANYQAISNYGFLNTICTNIATHVSGDLYDNFIQLVDVLQTAGVLNAYQVCNHKNNATVINSWQETNLRSIESFFKKDEEATTTISKTKVMTTTTCGSPTNYLTAPTDSENTTTLPTTSTTVMTSGRRQEVDSAGNITEAAMQGAGSIAASVMVMTTALVIKLLL